MKDIAAFLAELHQQGIKLWVDGERLRVNAPQGALTPALTQQLAAHKADILVALGLYQPELAATPIEPVSRAAPLPLSFAQQRLWFLDRLGSQAAYNIPARFLLTGQLAAGALEQALDQIVRRHEILRSNIVQVAGETRQIARPERHVQLAVVDLRHLAEAERQAEVQRRSAQEALRPFDLDHDLLLRATLLRLDETTNMLLLTLHHIAADGWSMALLLRELVALYTAFIEGRASPLPDLRIQYADFAQWQRGHLRGQLLDRQLGYWKQQLAAAPPLLQLPIARPRPAVQTFAGAVVRFTIDRELAQALRRLGRQAETTLFTTLLAGFSTLLARYTGQNDIVVDTPVAGRNHSEIEPLIGFFVNTLLIRADFSGDPTFASLLAQLRQTTQAALAHQELPFEYLVEALQPQRNLSYAPLAQVSFSLQSRLAANMALPGLEIRPAELEIHTARTDMEVFLFEGQEIEGEWVYNTDLFDKPSVERMVEHYLALLSHMAADAQQRIAAVPLLTIAERQQLVEWNDTARDYPSERCIHQLFEAMVERTPNATAAIAVSSAGAAIATLTYRELNKRANQLAHHLQGLGVGPGVLVGIKVARSAEMLIGLLGVLKAGGAYIPLDTNYPAERLAFMLEDARPAVLLTTTGDRRQETGDRTPETGDDTLTDLLSRVSRSLVSGAVVDLIADWPLIARQRSHNPASAVSAGDLAYVLYTSGSTGQPKGVMVSHRALANHGTAMVGAFELTSRDRVLQFAAFSFDVAAEEIFPTWLGGGAVVLPSAQRLLAVGDLLRLVADHGVTMLNLPASYWHEWVHQLDQHPVPPSVRLVVVGSEKVLRARLDTWLANVGDRVAWRNAYGLSETTITSTLYVPASHSSSQTDAVPIGRPIANTQLYLLDDAGQPVPPGFPGELYIGGAGLANGYLGRPELTAERFVPNPFVTTDDRRPTTDEHHNDASGGRWSVVGGRLYRTGDRARYLPDGNLEFLGRGDAQVKVRGFRIELGEIEAALARHPQVQAAAVLAHEDRPGDARLVAYIIPRDWRLEIGDEAQSNLQSLISNLQGTLRTFLRTQLPDYMIPAAFLFLDALPQLPNGKIDRRGLPSSAQPTSLSSAAAPSAGVEELIAAAWRSVLQLESIGVHDNFFDLGGSSLLLLRVYDQIKVLAEALTVVDLFQYPTISSLAVYIGSSAAEPAPAAQVQPPRSPDHGQVAIIGIGCRFPGARSAEEFWQNLRDGIESIVPIEREALLAAGVDPQQIDDPEYVYLRGVLPEIDRFDAAFFGYSPMEATATDPQHRLFMECAWEALEQAGYAPGGSWQKIEDRGSKIDSPRPSMLSHRRIGIYGGSGFNGYRELVARSALSQTLGEYQLAISNESDAMITHVAYKLNLTGPGVAINTACSTGLVAVHMACQSLLRAECDMALAGAISVQTEQHVGYHYQPGMIMSPDGHCRAFDAGAQGTAVGNGCGVVLLKPLDAALADGDHIYAVIKGSAINNDGARKVGYTAPSVEGQAQVIREALAQAEVDADTFGYVEAHGTGTPLGDPIEVAALTQAFRAHTQRAGFCALGSVKTNIGHLDSAAGIAGLIKAALALKHGGIPPSLHFATPNPQIDFASSPFYVNSALAAWPGSATPRRAGVSSFGIGGTNAHIILEQAPARQTESDSAQPERPWQLLLLSAKTTGALDLATEQLAGYLAAHPAINLVDVAYTLAIGRSAFPQRRIIVCRDLADAASTLSARPAERVFSSGSAARPHTVAFLFPGQGAQHQQMARDLYQTEPIFRQQVDRCCAYLEPLLGYDLRSVLFPSESRIEGRDQAILDPRSSILDPRSSILDLDQTMITQPALFVIEYALAMLWESWGVHPNAMLGHSIGEYVAATLAGVFALEDALALVAARGQMMQALPGGAMLAVSLAEADLAPLLGAELALAALNGPERAVVAGPLAAVDRLEAQLTSQGIACRRLQTSHAFHSPMMDAIVEPFIERVRQVRLNPPELPFLSNVTGTWISDAQATDPAYWGQHLRQPVRFAQGLSALLQEPERILLEVGPGQALRALAQQQPAAAERLIFTSLPHPRQAADGSWTLNTLGQLWMHGATIDWAHFYAHAAHARLPLPTYPFERQRYWVDTPGITQQPSAPPAKATQLGRKPDIADWFYLPTWREVPIIARASAHPPSPSPFPHSEGGRGAGASGPSGAPLPGVGEGQGERGQAIASAHPPSPSPFPHSEGGRGAGASGPSGTPLPGVGEGRSAEGGLQGERGQAIASAHPPSPSPFPHSEGGRGAGGVSGPSGAPLPGVGEGQGERGQAIASAHPPSPSPFPHSEGGRGAGASGPSGTPLPGVGEGRSAEGGLQGVKGQAIASAHPPSPSPFPHSEGGRGAGASGPSGTPLPGMGEGQRGQAIASAHPPSPSPFPHSEGGRGAGGVSGSSGAPLPGVGEGQGQRGQAIASAHPPSPSPFPHSEGGRGAGASGPSGTPLPGVGEGQGERGQATLIFADTCGLGERLAQRLADAGHMVVLAQIGETFAQIGADRYMLNPTAPADYAALLAELRTRALLPNRVVHLWSVTPDQNKEQRAQNKGAGTAPLDDAAQAHGFTSLLLLAQALGPLLANLQSPISNLLSPVSALSSPVSVACHMFVVSNNMQALAGEQRLDPAKATLFGPVTVIPQEYAALACCSVDVILPAAPWQIDRLQNQLLQEIASQLQDAVVAYRGSRRWVRAFEPAALAQPAQQSLPIRKGGVYLITGGLGGMGLALANHLAETAQAKLVLTSRSSLPPRSEWAQRLALQGEAHPISHKIRSVEQLERLGAEVLVLAADVADQAQMAEVLRVAVSRFGLLNGVVHAAGLPGGGLIQQKRGSDVAQVLAPKVQGALVLDRVLAGQPLDWLLLCSSLTAVVGGLGQVDYCAANAFLDAFARYRTGRDGSTTISINWDTWRDAGMALDAIQRGRGNASPLDRIDAAATRRAVAHPLFDERVDLGADEFCYVTAFDVHKHWVLHEHRLLGMATLPATAYLEMARAAFADLTSNQAVELRDVFLLQPLIVGDAGQVEVYTQLQRSDGGWHFSISSRADSRHWVEHARGGLAALATAPPRVALPSLAAGVELLAPAAVRERSVAGPIEAGPRWQTFQEGRAYAGQGVARFELALEFRADLEAYLLHPALLDGASNFFTETIGSNYVPFSYRTMRMYAPLPHSIYSTIRRVATEQPSDESCAFDITIVDAQGQALVEIEGYGLRALPGQAAPEASSELLSALAHGVSSAEGVEIFNRVLAHPFEQVLVSTCDLAEAIEQANTGQIFGEERAASAHPIAKSSRPPLAQAYVAPRNEIEARIAQCWQDFLGIEPIGVYDDFFSLGGDSLLAIQLTTRLSAALQQQISPSAFLQAPTVAALAASLEPARAGATSQPSALLTLNRGSPEQRPLFLIHPVGGSAYHYRQLAQSLGAAQPVYALASPGLDGEAPPLTEIAAMASHYLRLVRQAQPDGPALIGGWSLGGLVAFEMAQQLQAQQQEVALLLMIDTLFPIASADTISDAQYAAYFADYLAASVGRTFAIPVEHLQPLDLEGQARHILALGQQQGILPPELEAAQLRHRLAVYKANFRAMDSYIPQPYRGQIAMFVSSESIKLTNDSSLGWGAVAAGALTINEIPGSHYSIIDNPLLAEGLRACLENRR